MTHVPALQLERSTDQDWRRSQCVGSRLIPGGILDLKPVILGDRRVLLIVVFWQVPEVKITLNYRSSKLHLQQHLLALESAHCYCRSGGPVINIEFLEYLFDVLVHGPGADPQYPAHLAVLFATADP